MRREGGGVGRRLLILLLLVLVGCGPAPSPPPPATGPVVRLATWNVHNLFDAVDDPYADPVPTEAEVEAKIRALAAVLEAMEAHMVALQEVENAGILHRLAGAAGYPYAVLEEGNDRQRGIDVAFLSRLPLKGYRTHKEERLPYVRGAPRTYHFSRDCLEVHVEATVPLVVLVNHFKSQIPPGRRSDAKRRAQALGVLRIARRLEKEIPGVRLAVVGDLNDDLRSWALEPLLQAGFRDPMEGRPLEERFTYRHSRQLEVLDHILVNRALEVSLLPGSARVIHLREAARASDHFPVVVDLKL